MLHVHFRNKRHELIYNRLCAEQERRDQHSTPEDPGAWILKEREAMLTEVNEHRNNLGKEPLSLEDVERVENRAVGHFDYTQKYALYCTELVEDTP